MGKMLQDAHGTKAEASKHTKMFVVFNVSSVKCAGSTANGVKIA